MGILLCEEFEGRNSLANGFVQDASEPSKEPGSNDECRGEQPRTSLHVSVRSFAGMSVNRAHTSKGLFRSSEPLSTKSETVSNIRQAESIHALASFCLPVFISGPPPSGAAKSSGTRLYSS